MDHHHQYTQHHQHLYQQQAAPSSPLQLPSQPQPQQQEHPLPPPTLRPQQPQPQHPQLHTIIPPHFHRTGNNTPVPSPGLFSPTQRPSMAHPSSDPATPAHGIGSPYLHPLQGHKVRETHSAFVERDSATGRKFINQYEVIEEIGRGVHGKVKLARAQDTTDNVAIKIIPRFSKTRRLGKLTAKSPVDKTKREIAILKKVRHPNVVGLLEVIDDPELKKIYMVLEHVELGEVRWRKKGLPHICHAERRRIEREMSGEQPTEEEQQYTELLEKRQALKDLKRAKIVQGQGSRPEPWSFEAGAALDDEMDNDNDILSHTESSRSISLVGSRNASKAPSRVHSLRSMSRCATPQPIETIEEAVAHAGGPTSAPASAMVLEGSMYDNNLSRARSPSMADSIISHMSSIDFGPQTHDAFADDYSYVPCLPLDQAQTTFRDTVLGLEYLHYQGIIHRDIKPANLLCTRDHRVKISDFGVSYFGRPIREGEPDDLVSESEAHDFVDDERELAKTVGTPAFFAPELCYTDLDVAPPKISEQIDVWSLGVTLYCLIFARIPFLAEDEFQMFKKIATEEVHIPRRRLRPVDPSTSASSSSDASYRDDNELEYEEIDDLLHDLLKRMLVKNPEKRIRLQEVKRHPWVVQGIQDLHNWVEETDPRREAQGKRIQVDEREMSFAVIPLTLLERAKSAVKKTYNKVVHGRTDGGSRRRATSSVASSAGDSTPHLPMTPHPRDLRRRSMKPDDYFQAGTKDSDHPLSQSIMANPQGIQGTPTDQFTQSQSSQAVGVDSKRYHPGLSVSTDCNFKSDVADQSTTPTTTSSAKPFQRHGYARSITNAIFSFAPSFHEPEPISPTEDGLGADPLDLMATVRKTRDIRLSTEDSSRARSVDRAFFYADEKRRDPHVVPGPSGGPSGGASGTGAQSRRPRPMRSIDLGKANSTAVPSLPSPLFFSPRILSTFTSHPKSNPNMRDAEDVAPDTRPITAHRIEDIPEDRIVNPQRHQPCSPVDPPRPCSPEDDHVFERWSPPTRENTCGTIKSSSSNSIGGMTTPLTSPTAMTSPICAPIKENLESMLVFQSDPSLPALLSGASSVSADAEGDFLMKPGLVDRSSMIESTDSVTPPAIVKETSTGFPMDEDLDRQTRPMEMPHRSLRRTVISPKLPPRKVVEDDSDSDSDDDFLMMGKGKKKMSQGTHHSTVHHTHHSHHVNRPHPHPHPQHAPAHHSNATRSFAARRRDTNVSIGSTDTAKKVSGEGE